MVNDRELTSGEAAVLARLREDGPTKLSNLNEDATDAAFKRRPKLVYISKYHPDDPVLDISREGMLRLAEFERRVS